MFSSLFWPGALTLTQDFRVSLVPFNAIPGKKGQAQLILVAEIELHLNEVIA